MTDAPERPWNGYLFARAYHRLWGPGKCDASIGTVVHIPRTFRLPCQCFRGVNVLLASGTRNLSCQPVTGGCVGASGACLVWRGRGIIPGRSGARGSFSRLDANQERGVRVYDATAAVGRAVKRPETQPSDAPRDRTLRRRRPAVSWRGRR